MDVQVGDVIQTKKPHPCGANRFDVLRVGMDFNVDPMSAVLWSKAGDEMHVWDMIELRNSGTEEMATELRRRGCSG